MTNQTLIYDEDCPLCRAYSSAFVKTGMLDKNGKMPYSALQTCSFIDRDRAANEIALVDLANSKTIYGIDSLLAVIGNSFPLVEKIGKTAPVHYLLKKLYRFVSYNRKVIMPNTRMAMARVQCLPDFNVRYRVCYLIFATILTAITLNAYAGLLPQMKTSGLHLEITLAFGQIFFQALFLLHKGFRTTLDYAGHLLTVSLMGALLLLPMLIASRFVTLGEFVSTNYFLLVASAMFIEHFRRVDLLGLPKILCATWVLYRVLFLILFF
nr:hypothetical protein [Flavobacterium selenitireducens]